MVFMFNTITFNWTKWHGIVLFRWFVQKSGTCMFPCAFIALWPVRIRYNTLQQDIATYITGKLVLCCINHKTIEQLKRLLYENEISRDVSSMCVFDGHAILQQTLASIVHMVQSEITEINLITVMHYGCVLRMNSYYFAHIKLYCTGRCYAIDRFLCLYCNLSCFAWCCKAGHFRCWC